MPESLLSTPTPLAAANRSPATYTIVVADDSFLIRAGILGTLADENDVEVAQCCRDLPSLLGAVEAHRPDVVITGIRLPPSRDDEGVHAAVMFRETHPDVGVVVLSPYIEPRYALALFARGTARRAYLDLHHLRPFQLMDAVREVAAGGSVVDSRVVDVLVDARMRAKDSPLSQLTKREREVLAGLAAGKANAAIANSLFLTKRAVEKNINSIFSKLNLDSDSATNRRVAAALLFLADSELGRLDPSPVQRVTSPPLATAPHPVSQRVERRRSGAGNLGPPRLPAVRARLVQRGRSA
jgi:DNA-binding NarL/FixJ family response regulator